MIWQKKNKELTLSSRKKKTLKKKTVMSKKRSKISQDQWLNKKTFNEEKKQTRYNLMSLCNYSFFTHSLTQWLGVYELLTLKTTCSEFSKHYANALYRDAFWRYPFSSSVPPNVQNNVQNIHLYTDLIASWQSIELPESTKKIEVDDCDSFLQKPANIDFQNFVFPKTLKTFLSGVVLPVLNLLPQSLTTLHLGAFFDSQLEVGCLPPTLTDLNVGLKFNQKIQALALPSRLLKLHLGFSYDHTFEVGVLPNSLTSLIFSELYKSFIVPNVLPSNLQVLKFGLFFSQENLTDILPQNLKELRLHGQYNKIINIHSLPLSLNVLAICDECFYNSVKFCFPNINNNDNNNNTQLLVPPNLLKLCLFNLTDTNIVANEAKWFNMLPHSLQSLRMRLTGDARLFVFPPCLTKLDLDDWKANDPCLVEHIVLPSTLVSLQIPNYHFAMDKWPTSITKLSLDYRIPISNFESLKLSTLSKLKTLNLIQRRMFSAIIPLYALPTSLTKLKIWEEYNLPLNFLSLLTNLKHLMILRFNRVIKSFILPQSLLSLKFHEGFNSSIAWNALPLCLTHLELGRSFNKPVTFLLPASLIHLDLGAAFKKPITFALPYTLRHLLLGIKYPHKLCTICILPSSTIILRPSEFFIHYVCSLHERSSDKNP